jgi:hypothetical protein
MRLHHAQRRASVRSGTAGFVVAASPGLRHLGSSQPAAISVASAGESVATYAIDAPSAARGGDGGKRDSGASR